MALYRYVKKQPVLKKNKKVDLPFSPKIFAGFLLIAGLLLFINAAYPIISYQLFVSPRFSKTYVSPTAEAAINQSFGPAVLSSKFDLVDYTQTSDWTPEQKASFEKVETGSYLISIPEIKVNNAKVVVGLENLDKNLVQYPGTAAPGTFGNTVIFGHSVLPQFFNPQNYKTIFSTLPTLEPGDEIWVEYNLVRYKFVVEQMIEVRPDDISILAQRYDDSYLTLITCVPPGTYLKRLIVRARLAKM